MKGLDNNLYVTALIAFNIIAIVQLVSAIKWPRIARVSFFILFAWASWTNWSVSQHDPQKYLEYADLTWNKWYREFINGWFANHIQLAVGFVATCQGLIAVSMQLKGWIYTLGCIGGIIFLVSILPLGVGSGFPCTGIMAVAVFILLRKKHNEFIWRINKFAVANR